METQLDFLLGQTRSCIQGLIHGDLKVRAASLQGLARAPFLPTLIFLRNFKGQLSHYASFDLKRRILVFPSTREQETTGAIRIQFHFEPVPQAQPALTTGPVTVVLPPFLKQRADASGFVLSLAEGYELEVADRNDGTRPEEWQRKKLALRKTSGPSTSFDYADVAEWLVHLATWVRQAEQGQEMFFAFSQKPQNPFNGLAQANEAVQFCWRGLRELFDQPLLDAPGWDRSGMEERQNLAATLMKENPRHFGSHYELEDLRIKFLLHFDASGRLYAPEDQTKEDIWEGRGWHQLDFHAEHRTSEDAQASLRFTFFPADFLVGGALHQHFLNAIRSNQDEILDSLAKDARDKLEGLSEEEFFRFVRDPERDNTSYLVRISPLDHTIFRMRGALRGQEIELLYRLDFDVGPFPDLVIGRVRNDGLLYFKNVTTSTILANGQLDPDDRLYRYLVGLFSILLCLRAQLEP